MKTITLQQFANAADFRPMTKTGKPVGPKPVKGDLSREGSIRLSDLKVVNPTHGGGSKLTDNAYIRQQLMKDIRSFLQPYLDIEKNGNPKYKDDRRWRPAKDFLYNAEKRLLGSKNGCGTNQEKLDSDLGKGTVRNLLKRLYEFAVEEENDRGFMGNLLKQEDMDVVLVNEEKRKTGAIPKTQPSPKAPVSVKPKNLPNPSPQSVKHPPQSVKFASTVKALGSKMSAKLSQGPKKFASAPMRTASKPNAFVAFLKGLFSWLSPKSPKQK